MVTSNCSLSLQEVFSLYAKRWTIELVFKETKQLLKLQGCQSTSLDHQKACIALSMVLYGLIAAYKSMEHYYTIGGLFASVRHNLSSMATTMKLWQLLMALIGNWQMF